MATPKIKLYKINKGYTQNNDADIQNTSNDELLPIVDKNILLDNAYYLQGVEQFEETLLPLGTEYIDDTLSPNAVQIQNTGVTNWQSGYGLEPVLKDSTNTIIPTENYVLDYVAGTVTFDDVIYDVEYPSDVTISYYTTGSSPCLNWYTTKFPLYIGPNYVFEEEIYDNNSELLGRAGIDYTSFENGVIKFLTNKTAPTIKGYQKRDSAKIFVSDYPNWVVNHLRTNPDIFLGMYDYPGDNSEDGSGNPIEQGAVPLYVDEGFQIDYRNGSVTFSETIDTHDADFPLPGDDEYRVRANFAYYSGLKNVTKQQLEFVEELNGFKYKPTTEKKFPDSHGKRWIMRNDYLMPRFFEIDGEMVPKTLSVSPYDDLTLWEETILNANDTHDFANKERAVIKFTGIVDTICTCIINSVNVIVKNVADELVWDFGATQVHTFTTIGEKITCSYNNLQVDITWNSIGIFTVDGFIQIT